VKYLLIVVAVLGGIWLWRSGRKNDSGKNAVSPPASGSPGATASNAAAPAAQTMVRCESCAVHLPESEAVRGKLGWYCGAPHRIARES
jgi:uncharacterized protein